TARLAGSLRRPPRRASVVAVPDHDAVDGPEERREDLARTGGGDHEGVLPAADRLPGSGLRDGRAREGGVEPCPRGGREPVEDRVLRAGHAITVPPATDTGRPDAASGLVLVARLRDETTTFGEVDAVAVGAGHRRHGRALHVPHLVVEGAVG